MADNPNLDPTQFKKQLKALLEDQGDYNNLLKDALRDLKQLDNAYDKISARLSTMERSTVNLKEVGKELYGLKQKEYLESKKMEKLEKELGEESLKEYKNIKKQAEEYAKQNATRGKKVDIDKTIMALAAKSGNLEIVSLRAQEKFIEIAKKKREEGELALETERKVGKQIGITGNLFKIFTEKLGVGEEAYEAMTSKARDLVDANGKVTGFGGKMKVLGAGMKAIGGQIKESLTDPAALAGGMVGAYKLASAGMDKMGQAAAKTGNFVKGLSADSAEVVSGLAAPVADLVGNIPLIGGLLSGMISGFASVLDLVIGVEDKIVKAGRALGMNRAEAMAMNKEFAEMSMRNGDIFATSKALMEMQVSLSEQLGVNNRLTEEQLTANIHLKDLMGLDVQTMGDLTMAGKIAGKSQEGIVKSVLAQVQGLKAATGISLNQKQILKEASSLSGALGLQFAKYPEKLTKSLVTTKALGMELKALDGIADSFLDFESSISNEMEAQLLTGKNINLSKARELFLNNDLAGAALEINNQVGSSGDFLKMNRIQADSLAKAFGMSRDQLADMLKKQEYLGKLGAKETDNAREQLRLGLLKYGNQQALSEALGEEAYNSLVTASTQEKMVGFIEKVKQSLVDFLEHSGLVDKIRSFMDYLSKPENVRAIIDKAKNFMADAVEFIGTAAYHIINALDYVAFGQIPDDFIEGIKSGAESMGAQIRAMGPGGATTKGESVGGNAAASTVAATTPAKAQGGFAKPIKSIERGDSTTVVNVNMSDNVTTTKVLRNNEIDQSNLYNQGG
jgi:hypothetical protein